MRRHAFTLIELLTVCAVLALFAGVVMPNLVAMKAGRDRDEAYRKILRLAQAGRETAIQSGRTYTLTLTGNTVELDRETATDSLRDTRTGTANLGSNDPMDQVRLPASISGSGTPTSSTRRSSNSAGTDEADGASATIPSGASLDTIVLEGKPSTTNDFVLHFYPDGRSEGGGFEMTEGSATRSLSIDRRGLATLTDTALPATTETDWEAGSYVQRTTTAS